MKLQLPLAIYQWLQKLGIITQQGTNNGKNVEISYDQQLYFENGYSIGSILRQINKEYQLGLKNLGKIRQIATIKSHQNWQIIWQALMKLGIDTSYGNADITVIPVILGQLFNKFYETESNIHKPQQQKKKLTIESFNVEKQLYQAQSTAELILLALCQCFNISVEMAISLLADRHQLFNRVIVQGISQTRFEQVGNLISVLSEEADHLESLAKKDKSMGYVVQLFKVGLVSSNLQIAIKVIAFIKRLHCREEMAEHIAAIHLSMKRHPQIGAILCDLLQWTLHQQLVSHLKQSFQTYFPNKADFLLAACDMVRHMNYSIYKKQFMQSNTHQDWLVLVQQSLDPDEITDSSRLFMRGISLLTQIALLYDDNMSRRLSQLLYKYFNAKSIANSTICHSLHCCQCAIKLLVHHAQRQRKEARRYYQLLCDVLSMLPHYHDTYQFIINNMRLLFNRFTTMPQQPLLMALQKRQYLHQPSDYAIFHTLLNHPSRKLQNRHSIGRLSLISFIDSLSQQDFRNHVLKSLTPFGKQLITAAIQYLSSLFQQLKNLIMIPVNKTNRTQIKKSPDTLTSKKSPDKTTKSKRPNRIFYTQSQSNELVNQNKKAITMKLIIDILELLDRETLKDAKKIATAIKEQLHRNKMPLTMIQNCLAKIKQLIEMNRLEFVEKTQEAEQRQNTIVAEVASRLHTPVKKTYTQLTPVTHQRLKYRLRQQKQLKDEIKLKIRSDKPAKDIMTMSVGESVAESIIIQKTVQPQTVKQPQVDPLLPFSSQPPTSQPALLVFPELIQQHQMTYLHYLTQKHQKLFGHLFQSYIRLGHDPFIKANRLDQLLLPNSLHILLQQTSKLSKSPQSHFQHWLIELAYKAYEHNVELSEAQKLSKLLDYIKLQFKSRGQSTLLFQDPDEIYYKQSQQVRKLTEDAKKGEILPNGFVSQITRVQNYDHTVSHKFKIQQKYVISYQILSELLENALSIPLVEPVLIMENKLTVRPQVAMQMQQISPKKQSPLRKSFKKKIEDSAVSKMTNSSVEIDKQRLQKIAERRKAYEQVNQDAGIQTSNMETTQPNTQPITQANTISPSHHIIHHLT